MERQCFFSSPIGRLLLVEAEGCLTHILFGEELLPQIPVGETDFLKEVQAQLGAYFQGQREVFDLPLNPKGTDFQKKVWLALQQIPYGETASYGEIARAVGTPKGARAVGMANNRNPISIVVPCHRVIGADGKLVGYGGGLEKKIFLLGLEKGDKKVKG